MTVVLGVGRAADLAGVDDIGDISLADGVGNLVAAVPDLAQNMGADAVLLEPKAPEVSATETPVGAAPLKNDEPDHRAKKSKKDKDTSDESTAEENSTEETGAEETADEKNN